MARTALGMAAANAARLRLSARLLRSMLRSGLRSSRRAGMTPLSRPSALLLRSSLRRWSRAIARKLTAALSHARLWRLRRAVDTLTRELQFRRFLKMAAAAHRRGWARASALWRWHERHGARREVRRSRARCERGGCHSCRTQALSALSTPRSAAVVPRLCRPSPPLHSMLCTPPCTPSSMSSRRAAPLQPPPTPLPRARCSGRPPHHRGGQVLPLRPSTPRALLLAPLRSPTRRRRPRRCTRLRPRFRPRLWAAARAVLAAIDPLPPPRPARGRGAIPLGWRAAAQLRRA